MTCLQLKSWSVGIQLGGIHKAGLHLEPKEFIISYMGIFTVFVPKILVMVSEFDFNCLESLDGY